MTQTFDSRTEASIKGLLPPAQKLAREFMAEAIEWLSEWHPDITVKIIEGYRSPERQNELYAKGRTTPGSKVTNSRAWQSMHQYGCCFDIGLFREHGKIYMDDSPIYALLGPIGTKVGLEWGGSWKSFKDMPHYQLADLNVTTLIMRHNAGAEGMALLAGTKYDSSLGAQIQQVAAAGGPIPVSPKAWTVTVIPSKEADAETKATTDTAIVRFVAENLGATVEVDGEAKHIIVRGGQGK